IFDSGVSQGKYYFAMEYIRGEILNVYVREKHLSQDDVMGLFVKVCDAVGYAHQKGVIHRDIKPSNILVDERGLPRIVDFGLAKVGGVDDVDPSMMVSVTGQIMGTPSYMSPEQASGNLEQVDMRSDVYSLGVVLHELLTGKLPHVTDQTMPNSLKSPGKSQSANGRKIKRSISKDAETIVAKAMSTERSRRYPTAGALGEDIQRLIDGQPIHARRDSLGYVLRKSLRKHLVATSVASAFIALFLTALVMGWSLYLSGKKARSRLAIVSEEYREERDAARQLRQESQQNLYFAEMNLAAQGLVEAGGIERIEELVEKWSPAVVPNGPKQGWEWHFFKSHCNMELQSVEDSDWIWTTKFNPQGDLFAYAGNTFHVYIRSTVNPNLLVDLGKHERHVRSLAWSPDGRWLASGAIDNQVFVFDTHEQKKIATLKTDDYPLALDWHPNQPILLIGDRGKTLTFWDREKNEIAGKVNTEGSIQALDFSPDGETVAVGTWKRKDNVEIWDVATQSRRDLLNLHDRSIFGIQFSPDGEFLATCDSRGIVKVTSTKSLSNEEVVWSRDLKQPVWQIAWCPNSSELATAGEDRLIRIWDASIGEVVRKMEGHSEPIWGLDWSSNGHAILSGSHDGTVKVWDANSVSHDRSFVVSPKPKLNVASVAWHPNRRWVAICGQVSGVMVLDEQSGKLERQLQTRDQYYEVKFSPDGKLLAATRADGATVWKLDEPDQPLELDGHSQYVHDLDFSPDGKKLVTCGHDAQTIVWDIATGTIDETYLGESIHYAVDWRPARNCVVTGSRDVARIINLEDGTSHELPGIDGQSKAVAFSHSGEQVAVGTDHGMIYIHDLKSKSVKRLNNHVGDMARLSWSPDDGRLASVSFDQTLRLWDPVTGRQSLKLLAHNGPARSVAWSPDGKKIVTVGQDSIVRIWDASRGYIPARSASE
ncbi:MAG: protein kinase, partial [Planctomycetota bacterium]